MSNDATQVCTVPPPGWRCTRASGHDGPCAALRDSHAESFLAYQELIADYKLARAYFGTSATYMSREIGDVMDRLWPGDDGPTASWLCERAMVALWRAMGRPSK